VNNESLLLPSSPHAVAMSAQVINGTANDRDNDKRQFQTMTMTKMLAALIYRCKHDPGHAGRVTRES
jgi:hypothetical protein